MSIGATRKSFVGTNITKIASIGGFTGVKTTAATVFWHKVLNIDFHVVGADAGPPDDVMVPV